MVRPPMMYMAKAKIEKPNDISFCMIKPLKKSGGG
jgi:hypothetical protein